MCGDLEVSKIYCENTVVWERTSGGTSLSDYGISTNEAVSFNDNMTLHPPFYNPTNQWKGYIDLEPALSFNGISFFSGDGTAPLMYIPSGLTVNLYERTLPSSYLYALIEDNRLFGVPVSRPAALMYTYDNGSGKSFEGGAGYFQGYVGDLVSITGWIGSYVQQFTSTSTLTIPQYSADTLTYISVYLSHVGDILSGR